MASLATLRPADWAVGPPTLKDGGGVLSELISKKSWDDVIRRLHASPHEASEMTTRGGYGTLPLHEACKVNTPTNVIHALITACETAVSTEGLWGFLPIHLAVRSNSVDAAKALLVAYPDGARKKESKGKLPLHLACQWGANPDIVDRLLMAYPESIYVRDDNRKLPVDYAKELNGSPDTKKSLLAAMESGPAYCAVSQAVSTRIKAEYDDEIATMKKDHSDNVRELTNAHQSEVSSLETHFMQEFSDLERRRVDEFTQLEESRVKEFMELEKSHAEEFAERESEVELIVSGMQKEIEMLKEQNRVEKEVNESLTKGNEELVSKIEAQGATLALTVTDLKKSQVEVMDLKQELIILGNAEEVLQDHVDTLEAGLDKKTKELVDLKKSLASAQEEVTGLTERLHRKEAALQNSQEQVKHLIDQVDACERKLKDKSQSLERKEELLSDTCGQVNILKSQINTLDMKMEEKCKEAHEAQDSLKKAELQIEELETQYNEAIRLSEAKSSEIRDKGMALSEVRAELAESQRDFADAQEEVARLVSNIGELERKVGDMASTLKERETTLQNTEDQLNEAHTKLKECDEDKDISQGLICELSERTELLDRKVADRISERNELNSILCKAQSEVTMLKTKEMSMVKAHAQLEKDFLESRVACQEAQREIEFLTTHTEDLKMGIEAKIAKIMETDAAFVAAKDKYGQEIKMKEKLLQDAMNEVDALNKSSKELQHQLREKNAAIKDMEAVQTGTVRKLDSSQEQLKETRRQLLESKEQLQDTQANLQSIFDVTNSLRGKLKTKTAEHKKAEVSSQITASQLTLTQTRVQELCAQVEQLKELSEMKGAEISSRDVTIKEANYQLDESQKELLDAEMRINQHTHEIELLQGHLERKTNELKDNESLLLDVQRKHAMTEETLEAIQGQNDELFKNVTALEASVEDMSNEIDDKYKSLMEAYKEMEEKDSSLAMADEQIKAVEETLQQTKKHLQDTLQRMDVLFCDQLELQNDFDEKCKVVNEQESKLEDISRELADKSREIEEREEQLMETQVQLLEANGHIEECGILAKSLQVDLDHKIAETELKDEALQEANDHINQLDSQISTLDTELTTSHAKRDALEERNTEMQGKMEVMLSDIKTLLGKSAETAKQVEARNQTILSLSASINSLTAPKQTVHKALSNKAEALGLILKYRDGTWQETLRQKEKIISETKVLEEIVLCAKAASVEPVGLADLREGRNKGSDIQKKQKKPKSKTGKRSILQQ